VRIRKDSNWNVPEPELALVVNRKEDFTLQHGDEIEINIQAIGTLVNVVE